MEERRVHLLMCKAKCAGCESFGKMQSIFKTLNIFIYAVGVLHAISRHVSLHRFNFLYLLGSFNRFLAFFVLNILFCPFPLYTVSTQSGHLSAFVCFGVAQCLCLPRMIVLFLSFAFHLWLLSVFWLLILLCFLFCVRAS